MLDVSIVIPTLNEEERLPACLAAAQPLGAETIVADGGSTDRTRELAAAAGAVVLDAQRGRGIQLHAGAHRASRNTLLFLHADTVLSPEALGAVRLAIDDRAFLAGTFRLRFDNRGGLYRLYGWFSRFESVWTSFGDQGILIRRAFYDRLGGFPPWPILEDVGLLRAARRETRVRSLHATVTTSARRYENHGALRTQLRNGIILTRFLLGAPANDLARVYFRGPGVGADDRKTQARNAP